MTGEIKTGAFKLSFGIINFVSISATVAVGLGLVVGVAVGVAVGVGVGVDVAGGTVEVTLTVGVELATDVGCGLLSDSAKTEGAFNGAMSAILITRD